MESKENLSQYHLLCEALDILQQSVQKLLFEFIVVPEWGAKEITDHLTSVENISKLAKQMGFPDLLHLKDPDEEIVSAKFIEFLILLEEKDEIVRKLFLPEILATHNVLTLWPKGWEEPVECLQNILGSKFGTIVNSLTKI